jgi:two-component system, OmpR family, alkaline phosphatase synthesis response regulator PhoP
MTQRILIVEDHPTMREALRLVLEREDLDIVEAGDGNAALALARSEPPDLVLLDLHIPGMPGEEVLTELKADPTTSHARVIVVTATGEEGRERALAVGADAYFTKPFSPTALLRAVEQARGGSEPQGS